MKQWINSELTTIDDLGVKGNMSKQQIFEKHWSKGIKVKTAPNKTLYVLQF